jgi:hypothetical protein
VCVKISSDNVGTTVYLIGFVSIVEAVKNCEMMRPLSIYYMDYVLEDNKYF